MVDAEARDRVASLEALLEDVEAIPEAGARERALAAVQGLVELYGAGLERIVKTLSARDDAAEIADALAADELVSHLLLLHDLHPVPVEDRVRAALAEVRPYLESHGGDVDLVAVEEGVVRLRMDGSCEGCPSSTATLKLAIEDAIRKAAPEVEEVEADGVEQEQASPLLQIELSDALKAPAAPEWVAMAEVASLASGSTDVRDVNGEPVLFIRLRKDLYAYLSRCAACGASLEGAALADGCVECAACEARYDIRRAGRTTDGSDVQLRPVPLLHDDAGGVRVAVGAPA